MRRLLLGDWNRWIRDPIDVGRLIFAGGTLAFAAMGRSTAIGLAVASGVLLLARYVNLPRPYDLSLLLAMTLIAWGTALNLYGDWKHYDKLVHGISPALWSPVIYIVLNFSLTSFAGWLEARLRRSKKSTGAVVGADAVDELAAPGEHEDLQRTT